MANEEHLEILGQGVKVWNRWREENPDVVRPDLSGAFLFGADLIEAFLSGADLIEADLSGADLRLANLRGADLRKANLRGADLRLANLGGADLSKVNLSGANLSGANLSRADLRGADLSRANLREADLRGTDLREVDLSGANLSGADLRLANLGGADLSKANLSGANLSGADLRGANLWDADLRGANLSRARINKADLRRADISGADISEGDVIRVDLSEGGISAGVAVGVEAPPKEVPRKEVDFTVFYPMTIFPQRWYKLLAYVHLASAFEFVLADSRTQLGTQAPDFATGRDRAAQLIKQGAEIVIVPELPGCRFNPPRTSLLWLEDWHRAEFRLQAEPDLPGFELDMPATGRVAFYVGPILIGEVQITVYISRDARHTDPERPDAHETAKPYQSVFVSYSHKDTAIVDRLESAYMMLGMEYLRDVRILRSGEKWNPALFGKIEEADIFQLCWSYAAKASSYVEQEWRHALGLRRSYFIRPVYWEKPMPAPPSELGDIHFAYLELEHEDRAA
jgi:uncharacterized protein YjbI with pentapeptide repeats